MSLLSELVVGFLNASQVTSGSVVAKTVTYPFVSKTIDGVITGPIGANQIGYVLDKDGNHLVLPENVLVKGALLRGTTTFGGGGLSLYLRIADEPYTGQQTLLTQVSAAQVNAGCYTYSLYSPTKIGTAFNRLVVYMEAVDMPAGDVVNISVHYLEV